MSSLAWSGAWETTKNEHEGHEVIGFVFFVPMAFVV
jgi:hypothetical protein